MDMAIMLLEQGTIGRRLPAFFLTRLTRLAARTAVAADERERMLLARHTFAAFLDCLERGLGAEAHAIMARHLAHPAGVR